MIYYANGIKIGNAVLGELCGNEEIGEYNIDVDTFNNCRESGYRLRISKRGKETWLIIWMYQNRNSDSIAVSWGGAEDCDINNMYSIATYRLRTKEFGWREYGKVADFIQDFIVSENW